MQGAPPEEVTPFVFSDPTGKRWPRLRLILLIGGSLFFLGTVVFVQTLFVCAENECAVFLAAVERPVESVAKNRIRLTNCLQFAAVAEIYRSATSRKKLAGAAPAPTARAAEEIAK